MTERVEIGDRVHTAERVVAATIEAFRSQQWELMFDYTDPETLAKLMKKFVDSKQRELERRARGKVWEPAASPEEEEMREFLRMAAELPVTFHDLAGVESLDQVQALTPRAFIAKWAEARKHWELVVHNSPRVVVGSIALLPDYAMVVTRYPNTGSTTPMHVLCNVGVIGDGQGDWRLDATAQWFGLVDHIIRPSDDEAPGQE